MVFPGRVACLVVSLTAGLFADDPVVHRDVVYGHKAGLALTFDAIVPADGNGAGVMFMVSGGWVSRWFPPDRILAPRTDRTNEYKTLVDKGFVLFIVRHGSSPYFKVPDATADVRRATRYIRSNAEEFNLDPERLGVFGGSAGGHLSLMLGTTGNAAKPDADSESDPAASRVAAVVAYFPPVDLRKLVGPSKRFPALDFAPEKAESVSPIAHVSADDPPTLLIHGDSDRLVPLSNSERILKAFEAKGVEAQLIVLEGAGHGFRGDDRDKATKALVEWFEKHLTRSDESP